MPCFRTRSTCESPGQAPLCHCTPRLITNQPEGTFGSLRYAFGGDHPSQTTHYAVSPLNGLDPRQEKGRISTMAPRFLAKPLHCLRPILTSRAREQREAAVKVHGVFPSRRGYPASSPELQFHRAHGRDSAQIVTPFVQVGTYPTRNFATLGPLLLRPPFTGASIRTFGSPLSSPLNLPAPGRCQAIYVIFRFGIAMCFW